MIHGIELKIKAQREKLKIEERKSKDRDPDKIRSLKRSIRSKKVQIKRLKQKNIKEGKL